MYKINTQAILTTYQPLLEILRKNSEERISKNKNYQNFIKILSKEEENVDHSDFFGQNDLQLVETSNIMKDLLYLMEKGAIKEKAA